MKKTEQMNWRGIPLDFQFLFFRRVKLKKKKPVAQNNFCGKKRIPSECTLVEGDRRGYFYNQTSFCNVFFLTC